MKLTALNAIKYGGKTFRAGDVLNVDKKNAEYLVELGAAVEYEGGDKVSEYNGEVLFENTEDFNTLKVDELKAVCVYMELPVSGNKTELVAAIEAASEVVDDLEDDEMADAE